MKRLYDTGFIGVCNLGGFEVVGRENGYYLLSLTDYEGVIVGATSVQIQNLLNAQVCRISY